LALTSFPGNTTHGPHRDRDRVNDDLATTKQQLADALSAVDRFVQILERHMGKDSPQAKMRGAAV